MVTEQPKDFSHLGGKQRHRLLLVVERLFLAVEKPVARILGSGLLNPLYAAGPVAVFLLIILGITGVYVTLFYDFSFDASYPAVVRMNHLLVSRFMRTVHRYASDIFIVTVILHALRTFFTDRFRRPYWLAWLTGVVMLAIGVLAGLTGYWLIWDQNALEITRGLIGFVAHYLPDGENIAAFVFALGPRGQSWAFMLGIFAVHLLAFFTLAFFVWLHVRRLQRPAYFPRVHWGYLTFVTIFIVAVVVPAYVLAQGDFSVLPARLRADMLFLAFLPAQLRGLGPLFWGLSLALLVGLAALPWLTRAPRDLPRVTIVADKCTGCHLCALDCPYKAIEMVPRQEGPYKHLAVVHHDLCVSCSVCLGSCDDDALLWGDLSARLMAEQTRRWVEQTRAARPDARIKAVFACERHVDQGARAYVGREVVRTQEGTTVSVLTTGVRCAGAIHPGVLTAAVDAGADEVVVVGCPPDDCAHRQGNQWLQERLSRVRAPRLDRAYANAAIRTAWVPPNMFEDAVFATGASARGWSLLPRLGGRDIRLLPPGGLPKLALALALMAIPLLIIIFLAHPWFPAYPPGTAYVQVVMDNPVERLRSGGLRRMTTTGEHPVYLVVEVDGRPAVRRPVEQDEIRRRHADAVLLTLPVAPGKHKVRVGMTDTSGHMQVILLDRVLEIGDRRVAQVYFVGHAERRPH